MLEELLARIALALDRESIPYMVIGGQAVLLYGEPRLTQDIDVTVGLDLNGLPQLRNARRGAGLLKSPADVLSARLPPPAT